jgi:L-lysine 2,3-aminomutase
VSDSVRYQPYGAAQIPEIGSRFGLASELVRSISVAARVFPFRVNDYVLTHLIDWRAVPDDPIFRLLFPTLDMLPVDAQRTLIELDARDASRAEWSAVVKELRGGMNPHPSGQLTFNAPLATPGRPGGIQHKYPETVLFFPAAGQTCHAYCTFCFRWPQFVGDRSQRFAERDASVLVGYLRQHDEVRDVLITGGDALMMGASHLLDYLDAICQPELEHVETIRLGTKALTYWPARLQSDADAERLLRGLERVAARRKLAIMAHLTHPRELETHEAVEAIATARRTGAMVYCQGPLVRHVNDDGAVWHEMWTKEARLGCFPYYMFVERDTGARNYFEVPLAQAVGIFRDAYVGLPGLARTVRGPVMSADPGKIVVEGVVNRAGERAFSLRFVQARRKEWLLKPFYGAFDTSATWIDQLRPPSERIASPSRLTRPGPPRPRCRALRRCPPLPFLCRNAVPDGGVGRRAVPEARRTSRS